MQSSWRFYSLEHTEASVNILVNDNRKLENQNELNLVWCIGAKGRREFSIVSSWTLYGPGHLIIALSFHIRCENVDLRPKIAAALAPTILAQNAPIHTTDAVSYTALQFNRIVSLLLFYFFSVVIVVTPVIWLRNE